MSVISVVSFYNMNLFVDVSILAQKDLIPELSLISAIYTYKYYIQH